MPGLTSTAKKYSKNSTFQTTAIVVFIGFVMLIWMLTNENDSQYQAIMAKKAERRGRKSQHSSGAHTIDPKLFDRSKKKTNENNNNQKDHQTDTTGNGDDGDDSDDDFYRKQAEDEEQVANDPNVEDDPFHIQYSDKNQHKNDNHQTDNHHEKEPLKGERKQNGENNNNNNNHNHNPGISSFEKARLENMNSREYLMELDKPRFDDEKNFFHLPKSAGGVLVNPEQNKAVAPNFSELDEQTRNLATNLHFIFELYDLDETSVKTLPFYGTMCVGRDCQFITDMVKNLKAGIGHFIVVVNTDDLKWEKQFGLMQSLFPGRFTRFFRPQKLSCAESWNLITRTCFTQRPMPDQVFIANADWSPKATATVSKNFERYAEWSRTKLNLVANRYFHFSSFSYTAKGYHELGYFDEVIYPALAEDVEFHVKAVSKGLGELGLYDQWNEGSKHITRASAADEKIGQRNGRVARFDYILRKWNVRVPAHRDFLHSHPFKTPWNNKHILHNNSWVVDPMHRHCANTGEGRTMTSGRCFYNASVLQKLMPPGVKLELSEKQKSMHDSFPGGYH